MNCTSHIHPQDSDPTGTSSVSEPGAEPESGGKTRWTTSVPQIVNVGADLEGGAELDVHGGHEMLLLQQQEGLSVDLLRQELGGELLTTCQDEEDDKRKFLCYFKTAMICGLKRAVTTATSDLEDPHLEARK